MLTSRPGRERGVTLIEIAVVLAVVGISLMAVMPEVGLWMKNLRVRSAADAVQNGMQTARMEALRRNAPVRFSLMADSSGNLSNACVNSNASASWVVSMDAPAGACGATPDSTASTAPRLLAKYSATDATTVSVKGDGQVVVFNSFGQVDTANSDLTTVDFTMDQARSLRVQVNTGGRIRLCDPNVADTDSRSCNH